MASLLSVNDVRHFSTAMKGKAYIVKLYAPKDRNDEVFGDVFGLEGDTYDLIYF